MKKIKFYILLMILGLASCSYNEELSVQINILKTPEVQAYSGENYFGTRSNQEAPYWNGEAQVKPNDITDEERDKVVEWFETHPNEGVEWPGFTNYYVQQLWYSNVKHEAKNGQQFTSQNCVVEISTFEGENVFGGNDPFNKCRYIYNTITTGFKYNNSAAGYWSSRYKIAYIDGFYYIGFDVEAKPDGDQDANLNQHFINDPDGYYDDRIIKIIPADEFGNPIYPEIKKELEGEVEVNLHGSDKNGEYCESHLSIHVRHATNVEIFIPVPVKYYCEADDMAIVEKHYEDLMIHGGPTKIEYNINNNIVSLNIEFINNGIRIWTEGINEDVINYCREHYNDGITFEIWNYFNCDLETLKYYLNKSTIKFIDSEPKEYINSIQSENDCTVKKS